MVNPLTRCLEDYALPPFAQLRVSDIVPAIRTAIREYALDLNAIEDDLSFFQDDITWESVMDRLEIIDDPLNRLWRIVLHLSGVANSAELRDAKAEVQAEVLAIQSRRLQSVEIFEAMQTLRDGPHWAALSTEQQRMLDIAMLDMKLNGVTLTGGAKERFNEVNVRLKQLADIFSNNVLDATKSSELILHDRRQLEGVPDSLLAVFAREAVAAGYEGATAAKGPWKILLDLRNVLPVLRNCTNAATCEAVYRANRIRASSEPYDNTPVILEMLQLRQEMANLVGYPTFAEMNLADKMAPSVEVVLEMLHELRDKSFDIANDEMRELQAFAVAQGHILPLQPWDYFHWVERMRKDKYDLDNELIRSYFPISTVLPKMFAFLSKLFGIRIETAEESAETWHPDVHYYQIRALEQVGEPVVAQFYLDLYARPGEKKTGAWIEVVAGRSRVLRSEKADVRLPVFALMFNHSAPGNDKPYLMTLADVQSTFTMLGFGLRVGLTAAEHAMATKPHGIEWDAVGFVPQFMQNFCLHKETILSWRRGLNMDRNHGGVPGRTLKARETWRRNACRWGEARHFQRGLTLFDIFRRTTQEFSRRPPFHDDKYICSLDYIFPGQYPSSYYSYVWPEMLATDAFACFAEAKSDDELMALGRKFRDTILSLAGPRDPMEAFEKFRGRLPTTEGLLKQYGLE
ncbi:hypothetical protein LEN26_012875 [Aphanomyces euteiches]|nr:hypothetical protein LEN26_012875 [Aphanomyces euteiches]